MSWRVVRGKGDWLRRELDQWELEELEVFMEVSEASMEALIVSDTYTDVVETYRESGVSAREKWRPHGSTGTFHMEVVKFPMEVSTRVTNCSRGITEVLKASMDVLGVFMERTLEAPMEGILIVHGEVIPP